MSISPNIRDDDSEVLYALKMACQSDQRHKALALETWLPRLEIWRKDTERLAADIANLKKKLISGFYENEYPQYTQGEATHELQETATAEEVNGLVTKIRELKDQLAAREAYIEKIKWDACGCDLMNGYICSLHTNVSAVPLKALREHEARLLEEMAEKLDIEIQNLPNPTTYTSDHFISKCDEVKRLTAVVASLEDRAVVRCQQILIKEASSRRTK